MVNLLAESRWWRKGEGGPTRHGSTKRVRHVFLLRCRAGSSRAVPAGTNALRRIRTHMMTGGCSLPRSQGRKTPSPRRLGDGVAGGASRPALPPVRARPPLRQPATRCSRPSGIAVGGRPGSRRSSGRGRSSRFGEPGGRRPGLRRREGGDDRVPSGLRRAALRGPPLARDSGDPFGRGRPAAPRGRKAKRGRRPRSGRCEGSREASARQNRRRAAGSAGRRPLLARRSSARLSACARTRRPRPRDLERRRRARPQALPPPAPHERGQLGVVEERFLEAGRSAPSIFGARS